MYGSVVVVCRIAFAKVPDRLPSLPLGAAALLTITLGLGLAAVSPTPAGMLLGAALMGLGVTFDTPAFFSAIFATAPPSQRGAGAGTASATLDVGLGGGPIILGLVAESFGIPWAFGAAAGVALAGCFWTVVLAGRITRVARLGACRLSSNASADGPRTPRRPRTLPWGSEVTAWRSS